MGKIIRRVVAVLLTVTAIILAVLPAGNANATTTHGDYEYDGTTLVKYLGSESEVTVPNWVTSIGKDAFSGNNLLRKIVLPDSVTNIDYAAFENCKLLQVADIPRSVRTIGSSAFSGCSELRSISLPERLSSLGSGVFAGCTSLSNVPIEASNMYYTSIDGVIYSKDGHELIQYLPGRPFTSYQMPSSVNKIDEYSFWGASNLNKVSISPNVKTIPEYAFSNCNGIQVIALPKSVERINAFAFADCDNLLYINIPDSVGYIDDKAFYMNNGTKIRFVNSNGDVVKEVDADDFESSNTEELDDSTSETHHVAAITQNSINASEESGNVNEENEETTDTNKYFYNGSFSGESSWVSEIEDTNFQNNQSPGELASTKILGGEALIMLPSDTHVYEGYDIENVESEDDYEFSTTNYPKSDENSLISAEGVYAKYNGNENDVTVPENTADIGNRAFYKNENIRNVSLPSSISSIDDFAFARSNINSIDIPDGVIDIGYGAFYNCNVLSDVSIPSSVTHIDLGAFEGTRYLDDWKNNSEADDFLIVGDGILLAYKGNSNNIDLPPVIKHIGPNAFANKQSVESIKVPSSVIDIGEDAFNNCTNLSQVTLNEGLNKIDDRAFKNTAIKTIYIPDSVSGIGLGAFDTTGNNSPLQTVILAGNNVPDVTFNRTATRLSGNNLRCNVFEGVPNVIVGDSCNIDDGTMFNPVYNGFKGQIYSVDNADNKTLILKRATSLPNLDGDIIIDPHVKIGNDNYIMANVKSEAFDFYKDAGSWCDITPKSIKVNGNSSDMLNDLLAGVDFGFVNKSNGINVSIKGKSFDENATSYANIPDYNGLLNLNIYEDDSIKEEIDRAFYNAFNERPNDNSVYVNIDLYDDSFSIPIHKLGSTKMEVSMPVPNSMKNESDIRIATLDDNGLLTELSSSISDSNGAKYIDFVTGHCSPYIIYCIKSYNYNPYDNLEIIETEFEESNANLILNNSLVKTLNKKVSNTIEVKWFVIVILLSLAGILVLYKPRKIKN